MIAEECIAREDLGSFDCAESDTEAERVSGTYEPSD